jgi:hypothetical protein
MPEDGNIYNYRCEEMFHFYTQQQTQTVPDPLPTQFLTFIIVTSEFSLLPTVQRNNVMMHE